MRINNSINSGLNFINPLNRPTTFQELETQRYMNLLDISNSNPTIGAILRRDNFPKKLPAYILQNKAIQYLENLVNEQIDTLYPKTKKIRQYIVDTNRISLDTITKSKGYTWLDKLKIFLR